MNATTFDSLSAARRLKDAGLEQGPAEAIAETMHEATAANREDLATKADIVRLEAHINTVEARLRAEMVTIANRNLVATLVALGVLFAALKLF